MINKLAYIKGSKRTTKSLLKDLKLYRNYREDCLTYFKNAKEAKKYDQYIIAIETELTRRGVDFK